MGRRLGLIIGINNYQDTTFQPLQYAENDARALAQWLVNVKGGAWSPGDVQLVQGNHATKELIESLIAQMCLTLAEPDDLVFLYFAGHAFLDERSGDGYLALSNTAYNNSPSGLHLLSFVNQIMTRCPAAHMLVVIDAFQTGSAWQMRSSAPYDSRPLIGPTIFNLLQQQGNRIFFCSCRGNAEAPESGERGLGLFMHRSIVGLSGPARDSETGQVTLQSLYRYLTNILGEQQSPRPFGQERTPLILVGDASATVPLQQEQPIPANPPVYASSQRDTSGLFQQPATATMTAPSTFPTTVAAENPVSPSPDVQRQGQFMLNQARQLVQEQQYMQALNIVEQILRMLPQEAPALVLKGQILGTMGRFPEALAVVDQLMQLNERNPLTWSMRAVILTNMGELQNALQAIEHSIALDSSNPETQAIKKNIVTSIAMTGAQDKNRAVRQTSSVRKDSASRAFLVSIALQVLGLALGLVSIFLPALLGALLMGLGLAILCMNAARSTYRNGWAFVIPPVLTGGIALIIIVFGGLLNLVVTSHTPANRALLTLLQNHTSLLVPMIVLAIWLSAVAIVPPMLAVGGTIAGAVVARRSR